MGLLILLALGIIIYLHLRSDREKPQFDSLSERNQQWVDFIAGYLKVFTKPAEKAVVRRILRDIANQNIGSPADTSLKEMADTQPALPTKMSVAASNAQVMPAQATVSSSQEFLRAEPGAISKPSVQLDNASLLLYFGAFLFVAAAGLFVAVGGASGQLRTIVVLVVCLLMYGSGVLIYQKYKHLRQAGLAFAGIGIVLAPLVGVACYGYMFQQEYGPVVWFVTSLLCLALYLHALVTFRTPLLSYVFIFAFLSLFESGIGMFAVPVYYYGWGLALVGILLELISIGKPGVIELQEPSRISSLLLIPVSLIASVAMVDTHGFLQFGISLLLSAAYYGVELLRAKDQERETPALACQVAFTAGVAALIYGLGGSIIAAAAGVTAVNVVLTLWANVARRQSLLWHNSCMVVLGAQIVAMLASYSSAKALLATTGVAVVIGALIWFRQHLTEGYVLATLAFMAGGYIAGQYTYGPLSLTMQTVVSVGCLSAILGSHALHVRSSLVRDVPHWLESARLVYLIGLAGALVCAWLAGADVLLASAIVLSLSCVALRVIDGADEWIDAAGCILIVPMIRSYETPDMFFAATLSALSLLILLSLHYRQLSLRWLATGVWMLMPVALARTGLIADWGALEYSWSYLFVMAGLMLSRYIAVGRMLVTTKVPMRSYETEASFCYVIGYTVAGVLAPIISLNASPSALHTSIILLVLGVSVIVLSYVVEKREDILALLPIIGQLLLLSALRPYTVLDSPNVYLVASSGVAVGFYALFASMAMHPKADSTQRDTLLNTAVLMAFVPPFGFFFGQGATTMVMPLTLLVAAALFQYHVRHKSQGVKEAGGLLVVLGIWWIESLMGIRELQAYVHVLVALLAFYAYWRATLNDIEQSDQYIQATLAVATIPLALQALSSPNATYGYWLLFEQVVILLIGMSIQRKFVTLWGLWVAVGVVLFQLRAFGYGAIGFLAIVLIAVAIYKLQKYNKHH